jgi:hypothetical protein
MFMVETYEQKVVWKIVFEVVLNVFILLFDVVSLNGSRVWLDIFWGLMRRFRSTVFPSYNTVMEHSTLAGTEQKDASGHREVEETKGVQHVPPPRRKGRFHSLSTPANMRTSTGKPMVFHVSEEADLYFRQLKAAWDS